MTTQFLDKSEIYYKVWNTPVMHNNQLWLLTQIYNASDVHFLFQMNQGSNDIFVLSIPWTSPFRITEEGLGWVYIGDYFNKNNSKDEVKDDKKCSTFKVWNTSFAQNTYRSRPISGDEIKPEEIFQYVIITEDVWIEFVNLEDCIWTHHGDSNLHDLEIKYLKREN